MTGDGEALGIAEAATLCGCAPATIERLMALGLLPEDGPRRSDINGIRLIVSFETAGIGLDTFAAAARDGFLSLEFRRRLLPEPIGLSTWSFRQACVELGLDEQVTRREFIAAGLPAPESDRIIREDDLALLRLLGESSSLGISDESATRALTVFGRSSRLQAEAMRDLFRRDVEAATADRGLPPAAVMEAAARRRIPLQEIGFALLDLLSHRALEDLVFENVTMRIQDALSATGMMPPRRIADPAVAFIDITGFSRMTKELGDDAAAANATSLESMAQEATAHHGGRIIKVLGDGLLAVFDSVDGAVDACLEIMDRLTIADLPPVHVGLSSGPVVRRDGDIFGHTVNLAARLSGLADAWEIVAPADAIGEDAARRHWLDGGVVEPRDLGSIHIVRLTRMPAPRA
jgi:adenylate cyclase